MGGMTLPPGPREPAALQTVEWIVRPTAFLRRCRARHGDPFTVRVAWADAPMVLVSDPESIRRVFAADDGLLRGGAHPGREHAAAALEVALGFGQLEELDVVVRDLERGLIDFPSMINGEEVYLCWLLDEPEVVYWHAPQSGFGGRRPL